AAADPIAVTPADVEAAVVERERAVFQEQVAREGKPEHIRDRIVEGKLGKFFRERVLLEQAYIRDPDRSVGDLITEVSARTGEKIRVARFSRFQVGG
ncbi:MAG: elongation factor Ts, partial [Gemmatimonadetes bacterium]|nr:elongation factor Ts [Gemmatimonadota bacterium]